MNEKIKELEAKKEELNKEHSIVSEDFKNEKNRVNGAIDSIIMKVINDNGTKRKVVIHHNTDSVDIYGLKDNAKSDWDYEWDFGIYIRKEYDFDLHRYTSRKISYNVGTCGSFYKDSTQIELYKVFGDFCAKMEQIENDILAIGFEKYDELDHRFYSIGNQLRNIEDTIKDIQTNDKKNEILGEIKIGTVIDMKPKENLEDHNKEGWYYRNLMNLKNRKVEWMTKKNLSFDGDYGKRTKIDDVLNNLVKGNWKIVKERV